jgi:hypothetical protein
MEAFPEAKVIHTVRTDEDAWAISYRKQINTFYSSYMNWIRHFLPTYNIFYMVLTQSLAPPIQMPRTSTVSDIAGTTIGVKSVVPSEKLLVYSVEQGWEPLCKFTGAKIPDEPFPHLNKNCTILSTFQTETEFGRKVAREVKFVQMCFAIFVTLMAMLFYFYILLVVKGLI